MIQALSPLALSQSLTVVGGGTQDEQRQFGSKTGLPNSAKPTSAFVTQLLASRHSAAAFRQKRRCSPAEAQIAYRTTQTLSHISEAVISRKQINFMA